LFEIGAIMGRVLSTSSTAQSSRHPTATTGTRPRPRPKPAGTA